MTEKNDPRGPVRLPQKNGRTRSYKAELLGSVATDLFADLLTEAGLVAAPSQSGRLVLVEDNGNFPTRPFGEVWSGRKLSSEFEQAIDTIIRYLWPTMQAQPDWVLGSKRCIWASNAAAEFLQSNGFDARPISAVLQLYGKDPAGNLLQGSSLGMPDPQQGEVGTHNVVLIVADGAEWILETSLWQSNRIRFGRLPAIVLAEATKSSVHETLFTQTFAKCQADFLALHVKHTNAASVGLGWGLMPHRTAWKGHSDCQPDRVMPVVDALTEFHAGRSVTDVRSHAGVSRQNDHRPHAA